MSFFILEHVRKLLILLQSSCFGSACVAPPRRIFTYTPSSSLLGSLETGSISLRTGVSEHALGKRGRSGGYSFRSFGFRILNLFRASNFAYSPRARPCREFRISGRAGFTPSLKFRPSQSVLSGIDEHIVLESSVFPPVSSGRRKNQPARHMPVHESRNRSMFCTDARLLHNSVYRRMAGGSKFSAGYTAVEIIVVVSIMMVISSIVLVGFGGLNDGVAVNRSARDLAVSLRRAQNMSLAVTGVSAIGNVVPPAVGVELTAGSSVYYLFADRDDITSPNNFRYDPLSERIQENTFDRNVRVKEFRIADGPLFTPVDNKLNIVFSAPEANPDITQGDGSDAPTDAVDIVLESPGGKTKMITIRESGQISVK